MNVEVRSEAHLDIAEGVAFYDRQGYGAGDYFYQRIFEDIESLSGTAGIHERHFGYHRKIASRHPFLIYYRLKGTGVEVVAVLDGRSRPADIETLLQRR
jgi:plasmid stabilization system protein ParE